ncbi:MAG: carboxypeptidase regulatory-like domain-containing protein, partial [Bryobacteraceae bacterium]|nr:carboxypeptidase regulatory-like domain-containing protein [Bryobacteraceae bacterium]
MLLLTPLLLTQSAFSQTVNSSFTGIVADKSGAVIPNAKVTLSNNASGDSRRATTNGEGYFSINGIFPGTYSVTVEAPGFSNYKLERISFNPGDVRSLPNITLEVGATGTEVKVTDVLEQLTPVDSGEKSVVITTQQLQNVAIVSRSAAEFIKIIPGMTPTAGVTNRPGWNGENMGINGNGDGGKQSAIGNYSANGTPTSALEITADGAYTADPGCNCATPVNPNPDMISELKVQTSNFSAENYKGPVVISTITKSGGRDFHGTGYLYARHHSMNSNDWYNNKLGIARPQNKYFFPGGNLSGPVIIPGTGFNRNRDKLFFFAGFEYFKQTLDSGLLRAIVPTNAMRGGDFTDTAYLNSIGKFF